MKEVTATAHRVTGKAHKEMMLRRYENELKNVDEQIEHNKDELSDLEERKEALIKQVTRLKKELG